MALLLKLGVELGDACDTVYITDLTGAYNSISNTGGFGSPNSAVGDFSVATLTITRYPLPDEDSTDAVVYDDIDLLTDYSFPSSAELRVILSAEDFTIDDEDAELDGFSDGVWKFLYTISTSSGTTYTATKMKLFTCTVDCALLEQAEKIAEDSCNCCDNKDFLEQFLEAYTILQAVKFSGPCSNLTQIGKNLQNITDLLDIMSCRGC